MHCVIILIAITILKYIELKSFSELWLESCALLLHAVSLLIQRNRTLKNGKYILCVCTILNTMCAAIFVYMTMVTSLNPYFIAMTCTILHVYLSADQLLTEPHIKSVALYNFADCKVCMMTIKGDNEGVLPCGHNFHFSCIMATDTKKCPICSHPFELSYANSIV